VTHTTGDTLLAGDDYATWAADRQAGNLWFRARGWAEMAAINLCQKNMDDDRYGRERQFLGAERDNHNRLTTAAVARLLNEIFSGTELPATVRARARSLMARRHDAAWVAATPHAQVNGYFGADLPPEAALYSKAGWTGWTGDAQASFRRHDSAWIEMPGLAPFSLVVFTQGRAISESTAFFPAAAQAALQLVETAM
jgi:Beta-lactamase enzyme family